MEKPYQQVLYENKFERYLWVFDFFAEHFKGVSAYVSDRNQFLSGLDKIGRNLNAVITVENPERVSGDETISIPVFSKIDVDNGGQVRILDVDYNRVPGLRDHAIKTVMAIKKQRPWLLVKEAGDE